MYKIFGDQNSSLQNWKCRRISLQLSVARKLVEGIVRNKIFIFDEINSFITCPVS